MLEFGVDVWGQGLGNAWRELLFETTLGSCAPSHHFKEWSTVDSHKSSWVTVKQIASVRFGFRVLGSGFKNSGVEFWLSGLGFRVSGFGFQISGVEFRVPGFRFRISDFRCRGTGFTFWVSGFGGVPVRG